MKITIDLSLMEEREWDRIGGEMWLRRILLSKAGARVKSEADRAIDEWIKEKCELSGNAMVKCGEAYAAYKAWCEAGGDRVLSHKAFTRRLCDVENTPRIDRSRSRGERVYLGIKIKGAPVVMPPYDRD